MGVSVGGIIYRSECGGEVTFMGVGEGNVGHNESDIYHTF